MFKYYKIRIYPTKIQEQIFYQHIGACRYIWNYMVEKREELYKSENKHLSRFDTIKMITALKNDGEHGWLYDVSNASLQRICTDLQNSYELFYKKKARLPKFKSKKNCKKSFPTRSDRFYFKTDNLIHIEKVGDVKYKTDYRFNIGRGPKYINVRITNDNEKWMISFCIELESQEFEHNDYVVGIDLGIKNTMVAAYGDKSLVFANINKSSKMKMLETRIKKKQRSISRKYRANKVGNTYIKTNNILKEENELRRLFSRVKNIRKNYIHQSTHAIVSLMPKRVVMETLSVRDMTKEKRLRKLILEQCFSEISRVMEYKCEWYGIEFVKADRYYPSSKTCSMCGFVNKNLTIRDRIFVCPECGLSIDRDYQAALNLSRYIA